MMLMATKMVISKMVDDDGNGEGHQIIDKKEEGDDHPRNKKSCSSLMIMMINKLTKLGRCDRETIKLANNSNDSIVRTAGRTSK